MFTAQRKYTAFWAAFLTASVMLFFDKLTGALWVEMVIYIFGLFCLGNVGEHFSKKETITSGENTIERSGHRFPVEPPGRLD